MTDGQSPEQRELALVGKVEMRIALADGSKFESTIKTYLAPLLLKLASEHQSVRTKVITVCQHVNTRIKPQSVQLPVATLVKQFKEQESSLIRHFDLLYIQQGVGRLSNAEKGELLPVVVKGIASSGTHGPNIFNLFLRLMEFFPLPSRGSKEDVDLRSRLEVSDEDSSFLATWLGKLLLFAPQKAPNTRCPGLGRDDYNFLISEGKEDVWTPSLGGLNLLRAKVLAARFLASGLFNNAERFLPALFASADTASTISDVGEDMMKRAFPDTDLEDEDLIQRLYDVYFGSQERQRVRAPLRLKILGLFNKSTKSTTFANGIMRLVDDGVSSPVMDGEDTVMVNGDASKTGIGREATKLRSAIFTYINFVAKYGSQETLSAIASRVVNHLRDFMDNQGWPKPGPNEDLVSRGYVYEVIGLLAKAGPRSLLIEEERPTLDLLRWLFDSLAKDSSGNSITVSVEESLSTVLGAISRLRLFPPEQSVLEDLLIDQMELSADLDGNKRFRSTRYVAVRFANRCLPYSSVKGRWIDILGLGATKDRAEVKEEAERGLSPYWYQMLNGSTGTAKSDGPLFPTFESVMEQFFPGRAVARSAEPMAVARYAYQLQPESFRETASFARRMLFQEAMHTAGASISVDSEWERKLDIAVGSDIKVRDVIKAHLRDYAAHESTKLGTLSCALFVGLTEKRAMADDQFVDFLALAPDSLVQKLVPSSDVLIPILQSNNYDRRLAAAQAYGILASHPDASASKTEAQVRQLRSTIQSWNTAVGAVSNQVHGSTVALGYLFSRLVFRNREHQNVGQLQGFVETVLNMLSESRDDLFKQASHVALGQLCMFNAITTKEIESVRKVRAVVDSIYDTAKSGNETAILCMGHVSMILPEVPDNDDSDLRYIKERLHKLHEIRQAEVHFSVGEALSYLASGWSSGALATKLDIDKPKPEGPQRSTTLKKLLDSILRDCTNTKPALKKAAVMWLLCLVQFCGQQPEIQERLSSCQAAFKRCLSDRDELVQETASRGLGLVYEKGDRSLKDDLVRDLVSSFSSDRQSQLAGTVSADTQLFEPGQLPTGDGSVSTYKDIMSLASEVGDSSLVYRFMSMASSNAIWSSRAAFGRFGLSNVLSDSSVDGYLADNPKLYPKLFRYRFDPNGGVQRSMNDIWNALVKDSSATVDKYFDAIMEDLLTSILGKEWRVRQASCAAIADLVSGRSLDKYEQYLERIWTQCFKVLDDIKESVRAAASSLARTLTGVLTRALEADHSSTKNASAMLKHVLPFLLSPSGMESSAQEVQAFAVQTLLAIIKKANGSTLRPFIPELVERLIGLLSSLEPEAVNYVHLNASKYNLTEQKIDDMRLSSVRSSPLMDAIERCLDLLDDETMRALQPRLEAAMKGAVGLPSKVGSSRVLVSLATRRMAVFRPFADDFLKLIERLVVDRNETVASSYAAAAGYVSRSASDKSILRMTAFAKRLYFESEGDREAVVPRRSISSGEIMYALSKHAADRFNSLASSALPFVFVAKHDTNEQVREQFQNTWNESVGGSRAVMLYLGEILDLCMAHLDSPQWSHKHTSARTVADTVTAISSLETAMPEKVGEQLWPAIEKALSGKTWEGKDVVLSAFVKFVETGQSFYADREDVKSAITKIGIREAKRQNASYRQYSVKALGQIALARADLDMSKSVWEVVHPLLDTSTDGDAMDIDDGQPQEAEKLKEATRVAAIYAVFSAINPSMLHESHLNHTLAKVVELVASIPSLSANERRTLYDGLGKVFDRIRQHDKRDQISFDVSNLRNCLFGMDIEIEALRLNRADAIVAIAKSSPGLVSNMKDDIQALMDQEKSSLVRDRLRTAPLVTEGG
ncbi:proteasome component M29 [Vermiconidia calcicola]|uniref:Proteasome component M29 n=1 Tax=Vermiconidia calcicola TaxID=1690605 RepID=A0ACC3NGW4_9PEZI|nr:proteasome component M29 [Vermiconidia calcicola]